MKKKRISGHAYIKSKGLTAIMIALTPEEISTLDEAAASVGSTRPRFLALHGLNAAKKVLKQKGEIS